MSERYILRGAEQSVPDCSFGKVLYEGVQHGGFKIALVSGETGEKITYNEILRCSISLAQHLKKFGLTKGDVISISSENSNNFYIPALAAIFMGITIAPLNQFYTPREYIHALNISKPKIIFCSASALKNIMQASKEIDSVEKIIAIDNHPNILPSSIEKMETFLNLPLPNNFEVTPVSKDHVFAIMYSSGTTGLPKGVMLTHGNIYAAYCYLIDPRYGSFNAEKIASGLLPFYHAYGFICTLTMMSVNMKVIVLPRFEEKLFLQAIQQHKISYLFLVPPLLLFLCKNPLVDMYDLSSMKEIACSAAPLSAELQDEVMKRFNVSVRQGYGLTENTLAATMTQISHMKYGSVGKMVPGTEGKVINIETKQLLGPNQEGEICIRGTQVMKGYIQNLAETVNIIDKDGWLHTGDVGYYDDEGHVYIIDRYKELIKYKGYQVPPAEIEAILVSHPDIIECGVIGKPDLAAGELPMAFVVRRPNSTITESYVINFVAKNVSYHKRLHGGVKFIDTIPKNPTGKILRRLLRMRVEVKLDKSKL